jgi:hypothetical protein
MSRFSSCLAGLLLAIPALLPLQPARAGNNYPVVLVPGFLGFGPEQFTDTGFRYWGGFGDIVGHLQAGGKHRVLAATLAPIAINWDRAAELYYQIKGGCVDYGSSHTRSQPPRGVHRPPGKCWAADPPQSRALPARVLPGLGWRASDPPGRPQPGRHHHPRADRTARTRLARRRRRRRRPVRRRQGRLGAQRHHHLGAAQRHHAARRGAGLRPAGGPGGVADRQFRAAGTRPAESVRARRPASGPIRRSPTTTRSARNGARRRARAAGRALAARLYYSVATLATEAGAACCNGTDRMIAPFQWPAYQYPRNDMIYFCKPTAGELITPYRLQRGMGSYTQGAPGRVRVDAGWFANDGVVNTGSMKGPAGHPARNYNGTSLRGTWNFVRTYKGYDHFDILGWPGSAPGPVYPVYDRIGAIIYGL